VILTAASAGFITGALTLAIALTLGVDALAAIRCRFPGAASWVRCCSHSDKAGDAVQRVNSERVSSAECGR